jgi:hypothetical protein
MIRKEPGRPGRLLFLACALSVVSLVSAAEKDGTAAAEAAATNASKTSASEASSGTAVEIQQLKQMLLEQQRQINELRRALEGQNKAAAASQPAEAPAPAFKKLGEVGSTTPMIPPAPPEPALPAPIATQRSDAGANETAPLSLKIGDTYLTPFGFMDFTGAFRDTAPGSGIGTSFGSFPYRTQAAVNSNLSEIRESPQNSRIGFRFDTIAKGYKVLAYFESDFLGGTGNPPTGNIAVSTNSYAPRLRVFFVDVRKDKWEVLGGQAWSLITPGRNGISSVTSDVFYGQTVDVNYVAGIAWGRIPELRFVYHPNHTVSLAFAMDNPEQYIGGSSGGGTITLPSALATPYGTELSNGTLTLSTPNLTPDFLGKIAFDGKMTNGNAVHFEIGGIERNFKTYNPGSSTVPGEHFTKSGGAVSANLNLELFKGFRLLTNNYYSDGGGRYIFGQAPDLVVSSDGHLSLIHSMSTVSGFEFTKKNSLLYAYYGGIYIDRNTGLDANGTTKIGYGYSGAPNSQNKSIQEITGGINQTLWKDAKWGALNFMAQYAYFSRNPWYIAAGAPTHAYMNEFFMNLRYTMPGAAPTLK